MNTLSAKQLAAVFSCFTNTKVSDLLQDGHIKEPDEQLSFVIKKLEESYHKYSDIEAM